MRKNMSLMRLHIGGAEKKEGWKVLNITAGPHVDFVADMTDLSFLPDQCCEDVYASHVLEHIPKRKVLSTLRGINRIMIPGGRIMVSVPDLDVLCRLFVHPKATQKMKVHVMHIMFGGQIDAHDFHYMGWNFEFLVHALKAANFIDVRRVRSFDLFKDASAYAPYGVPISVNVVARKPS